MKRFLRYLAPNLVTMGSVFFGMTSILMATRGQFTHAAWFVIFSVMTDRMDGWVARAVKGTSEFGVQMDSFADFLNFGIAPAVFSVIYLSQPGSPMASGFPFALLLFACAFWVMAVVFRLARFNVVGDDPRCKHVFYGVPTTVMGGLVCGLFLTFLKYGGDVSGNPSVTLYSEPRLLGDFHVGTGVWQAWPYILIGGAFLMASTLRVVKPTLSKAKLVVAWAVANLTIGYGVGLARRLPELLSIQVILYVAFAVAWGQSRADLRAAKVPRLFPPDDAPPSRGRPEDDDFPEDLSA